jgi:hypothetical protein
LKSFYLEPVNVPRYKIIYESDETIMGYLPLSRDWIEYSAELKIRDGGKKPVSIDMVFEPPHPFPFNMPETHSIRGASVTDAYAKVVKFLDKFGIKFKN